MKNTFYKFKKYENEVAIFHKYPVIKHIPDYVLNNPSYYSVYSLQDDDRLEYISHRLYGTTDFWDILFLINNMDNTFNLPKSHEYVYKRTEDNFNDFLSKFVVSEQRKESLFNELLDEEMIKNDKYRQFKVVKPNKIQDFMLEIGSAISS